MNCYDIFIFKTNLAVVQWDIWECNVSRSSICWLSQSVKTYMQMNLFLRYNKASISNFYS